MMHNMRAMQKKGPITPIIMTDTNGKQHAWKRDVVTCCCSPSCDSCQIQNNMSMILAGVAERGVFAMLSLPNVIRNCEVLSLVCLETLDV